MNREAIEWGDSYAREIVDMAPQVLKFKALAMANKQEARYPSSRVDGGSRSTATTSPTERAALQPDPIEDIVRSMHSDLALINAAIKRFSLNAHRLESPAGQEERANSVTACKVCGGPCLPKVLNYRPLGEGPFDEKCYRSLSRFMETRPNGTYSQWLKNRVDVVDAA
jgi:hypothetical protein